MSGVIDSNGQQWEHCNICGKFVKFPDNLGYLMPTSTFAGADICISCVDVGIKSGAIQFENVVPASSWQVYTVE